MVPSLVGALYTDGISSRSRFKAGIQRHILTLYACFSSQHRGSQWSKKITLYSSFLSIWFDLHFCKLTNDSRTDNCHCTTYPCFGMYFLTVLLDSVLDLQLAHLFPLTHYLLVLVIPQEAHERSAHDSSSINDGIPLFKYLTSPTAPLVLDPSSSTTWKASLAVLALLRETLSRPQSSQVLPLA